MGSQLPSKRQKTTRRVYNVVLCGETGVGKSALVNLVVGKHVAETSCDADGCTQDAQHYDISLDGRRIRLHDTAGLNEPTLELAGYLDAVGKAQRMLINLERSGGISLLVFCMRAGRITASGQKVYRLFESVMCERRVPVAIVVTHLESEGRLEDWWARNEKCLEAAGVRAIDHACVTCIPTPGSKHLESSRRGIRQMLWRAVSPEGQEWTVEKESWLLRVVEGIWRFMVPKKARPSSRQMAKKLVKHCGFSKADAEQIAKKLKSVADETNYLMNSHA